MRRKGVHGEVAGEHRRAVGADHHDEGPGTLDAAIVGVVAMHESDAGGRNAGSHAHAATESLEPLSRPQVPLRDPGISPALEAGRLAFDLGPVSRSMSGQSRSR